MFYDGSKQAQKSADIVKSLAEKGDLQELIILALNNGCDAQAKELFSSDEVKVSYQKTDSYSISDIISLVETQKAGLVILPLEDELIKQSSELRKMLDVLKCPLLLVR